MKVNMMELCTFEQLLKNSARIAINKKLYEELIEDSRILSALRGAGVDNWDGYDDAMQSLETE